MYVRMYARLVVLSSARVGDAASDAAIDGDRTANTPPKGLHQYVPCLCYGGLGS